VVHLTNTTPLLPSPPRQTVDPPQKSVGALGLTKRQLLITSFKVDDDENEYVNSEENPELGTPIFYKDTHKRGYIEMTLVRAGGAKRRLLILSCPKLTIFCSSLLSSPLRI